MYSRLIPDIFSRRGEDSGGDTSEGDGGNGAQGKKRKKSQKQLVETDKGALFHKYDKSVHEWLTHLRRVHPDLQPLEMDVMLDGKQTKVSVKACDPLAPPGVPLYYYHCKTPLYNDNFFVWWDNCFAESVQYVCPWMVVTSKGSLEKWLKLKVARYIVLIRSIV